MGTERLQKILARGGMASRRAAEQLIVAGRVRVNGHVVTELGAKADPHKDRIELDGKRVVAEQFLYVAIHKPRGMVSTMSDPEGRPTVAELLSALGARVYPIGRLDFATSGILLATNDGDFANGMLHPKKKVPKTYVLKVSGLMQDADLDRWRNGVDLEDGRTLPAQAKRIRHEAGKTWFEITIFEGRNQQIRRMGEATGFPVMRLARTAFAGVSSEGLAPGRVRMLTREELTTLKKEYGVPRRVPSSAGEEVDAPRQRSKPDRDRDTRSAKRRVDARDERSGGRAGGAVSSERTPRGERSERGAERRPAEGGGARGSAKRPTRARGEAPTGSADRGGRRGERAGRGSEPRADSRSNDSSSSDSRSSDSRGRGDSRSSDSRGRGNESRPSDSRGRSGPPGKRPAAKGTKKEGQGSGSGFAYRATEQESPRLGGGAPGRRGYEVKEDWGGGSGRGRSGQRDEAPEAAPPGRGGRSRTTGTGGGIGAGEGNYRMEKGRRR